MPRSPYLFTDTHEFIFLYAESCFTRSDLLSEETRSFLLYTNVKKMSHKYTLAFTNMHAYTNACTARSDKHTDVHIHDHHLDVPQKLALLSSLG